MGTGKRWTLDIAHVVDDTIIRRHIVCLTGTRAYDLEAVERLMPGEVYVERSEYIPGDPSWTIEYRSPDAEKIG